MLSLILRTDSVASMAPPRVLRRPSRGPAVRRRSGPGSHAAVLMVLALVATVGCSATGAPADGSASGSVASSSGTAAPACPVQPLDVTVTVDQWGAVVRHLAGACAQVTTIVTGATGDPHEYEPTPGDAAAFTRARLVVMNGAHYDSWADKLLESASDKPEVVDAAAVVGRHEGDNPHLWYSPSAVDEVAAAVTKQLQELLPTASDYFATQAQSWAHEYGAVHEAVDGLRAKAAGKPYAATEPVFDDMAAAVGLVDATPPGYRQAAANESEPAPGDLAALEALLRDRRAAVLIVNIQTEGSLVDQLRTESQDAGVPVVEVTETMPADAPSFVAWQQRQLEALGVTLLGSP